MRWWALAGLSILALALARCDLPFWPTARDEGINTYFASGVLPDQFKRAPLVAQWRKVNVDVREDDLSEQCILHVYSVSSAQVADFLKDPILTDTQRRGEWRTRGYMRLALADKTNSEWIGWPWVTKVATSAEFPWTEDMPCGGAAPAAYVHLLERGSALWWDDRVPVLVSGGQVGGGFGPRYGTVLIFGILDLDERRLYLLLRARPDVGGYG
jgi:hypothetical protein